MRPVKSPHQTVWRRRSKKKSRASFVFWFAYLVPDLRYYTDSKVKWWLELTLHRIPTNILLQSNRPFGFGCYNITNYKNGQTSKWLASFLQLGRQKSRMFMKSQSRASSIKTSSLSTKSSISKKPRVSYFQT